VPILVGTNHVGYRLPWQTFHLLMSLVVTMSLLPASEFNDPEDVAFTSALDGSVQHFVQLVPKKSVANVPSAAMICLHGHGSDRWQYVKADRGECRGARDVAALHGMLFISPDYRAPTSWMGPAAEADLLQLITELREKRGVQRIFLVGASMGGTSALIFTALHAEVIDGVCSENGMGNMEIYDKFPEAIAQSYGGTRVEKPAEYRKRSAELFPQAFTMPLAITVGGRDDTVPPESVMRLGAVLRKAKRPVLVINREETGHVTSYADTVEALEFVLREAMKVPVKPNKKAGRR
jgi:predicted esterase